MWDCRSLQTKYCTLKNIKSLKMFKCRLGDKVLKSLDDEVHDPQPSPQCRSRRIKLIKGCSELWRRNTDTYETLEKRNPTLGSAHLLFWQIQTPAWSSVCEDLVLLAKIPPGHDLLPFEEACGETRLKSRPSCSPQTPDSPHKTTLPTVPTWVTWPIPAHLHCEGFWVFNLANTMLISQ